MALKTNAIAAQLRQANARIERTEKRLAQARQQAQSNFYDLAACIASDHKAVTCQSIGQYRTMLLKFASQIINAETEQK